MAIHALLPQGIALALTASMGLVIVLDASRYTIPNTLNGGLLLFTAFAALVLPFSLTALLAAAVVLGAGLLLFFLGLMGGGDVKLLVVLTLWTGWGAATVSFLFLTAIAGGLLVVALLLLRALIPTLFFGADPTRKIPAIFTRGQPVPYGIAIAAAFLWMLWTGQIQVLPAV